MELQRPSQEGLQKMRNYGLWAASSGSGMWAVFPGSVLWAVFLGFGLSAAFLGLGLWAAHPLSLSMASSLQVEFGLLFRKKETESEGQSANERLLRERKIEYNGERKCGEGMSQRETERHIGAKKRHTKREKVCGRENHLERVKQNWVLGICEGEFIQNILLGLLSSLKQICPCNLQGKFLGLKWALTLGAISVYKHSEDNVHTIDKMSSLSYISSNKKCGKGWRQCFRR